MVEVPAAALLADRLAEDADFFSIGTNDLTQYTLAADRGNERVGALADAVHPAVLRSIRMTVEAADARGRWVGVCGELAGDADATPLLLGLGVRELSMGAPSIALVKRAVRGVDLAAARALADEALACASAAEVRELRRGAPGAAEGRCYDAVSVVRTPDERAAAFLKAVTWLRVALTPVVMALVLVGDRVRYAYVAAAVLFAIAAATDFFDGFLARRWTQTTILGNVPRHDRRQAARLRRAAWRSWPSDAPRRGSRSSSSGASSLIMGLRGAVSATDGTSCSRRSGARRRRTCSSSRSSWRSSARPRRDRPALSSTST